MKYRVKYAEVEVYIDDYEHGELDYVQTFDLPIANIYNSMEDVLKAIGNTYMGFSERPRDYGYMDGRIYTSSLVDVDNCEVTDSEVEAWKKGELTLYSAHLYCGIDVISDTHELTEAEAEALGFEAY